MDYSVLDIFEKYLLAILLGALMGLERERKEDRLAGLRTFILATLFGSICGQIADLGATSWVPSAGMLAVAALATMILVLRVRGDLSLGLTTATALLVAYGIGILVALEMRVAAVALSLATTVILYFKPQLHQFSQNLSKHDLYAIFQFGLIAFIIFPILPDRSMGPYDALNPSNIWLMVVMISAINLFGYVTLKLIGQRWGAPVLGFLGGIVSSTATTLSISRHAQKNQDFSMTGAVVVSLASAVVPVRMAFLVGVVHPELLLELVVPLTAMLLAGLVPVFFLWRKSSHAEAPIPETGNPMELKHALLFGLLYAIVLLGVSAAKDWLGSKGVYIVALVSGLTDVDAITLSNARLAGNNTLGAVQAAASMLIAYVANLVFKLGLVGVIGTLPMFRWTLLCFACMALPALLILL